MKILEIDYGDYSIGLAIYDNSIDFIHQLFQFLEKKRILSEKVFVEIQKIIIEENIKK